MDSNLKAAVIKVSATRVYRQKFALFPESGRLTRSGEIRTPLQCGVRPGAGSFLFTGRVHFGEAWLGCAPRYKDFLKVYEQAKQSLMIPCTLVNDWRGNTLTWGPNSWFCHRRWSEKLLSKWKKHRQKFRRTETLEEEISAKITGSRWISEEGHLCVHVCLIPPRFGVLNWASFFNSGNLVFGRFDMNIISLKYPKSSWCWRQTHDVELINKLYTMHVAQSSFAVFEATEKHWFVSLYMKRKMFKHSVFVLRVYIFFFLLYI